MSPPVTDPAGMETTSAYDMLSRRTEEIQDAGQGGLAIKVTWQYDDWDGGGTRQSLTRMDTDSR